MNAHARLVAIALLVGAVAGCAPVLEASSERDAAAPLVIAAPPPGASFWSGDTVRVVVRPGDGDADAITVSDGTTVVPARDGVATLSFASPGGRTLVARSATHTSTPVPVLIKDVADACEPSGLIDVPSAAAVDALVAFEATSFTSGTRRYREDPLADAERDRARQRVRSALRRLDQRALATLSSVSVVSSIRLSGVPQRFSWNPSGRSVTVAWDDDADAFELALLSAVGAHLSIWTFPGELGTYRSEALTAWLAASPAGPDSAAPGRGLDIDPVSIAAFGALTEAGRASIAHDVGSTLAHLVLHPDRVFHYAATDPAIGRKVALASERFEAAFGMGEAYFRCLMYER